MKHLHTYMSMIKIVLVDDHKLVRDGIRAQLENDHKYWIVAEASDGQEALNILEKEETKTNLIIMDINMEGMNGITCTEQITKLYPEKRVLALTMLTENQHIKQMLKAGASGYLLKNCDDQELKNAIDAISEGGTYFSPEVTRVIMNNLSGQKSSAFKTKSNFIPLTNREKEVLRHILKEMTNKEIAEALFISQRTVDAHKRNLLEKTNSKNIAGLVLFAISHQIFDDL